MGWLLREERPAARQRGWGRGAWGCAGHGCHFVDCQSVASARVVRFAFSCSSLEGTLGERTLPRKPYVDVTPAKKPRGNRVAAIRRDFRTATPIFPRLPLPVCSAIVTCLYVRARACRARVCCVCCVRVRACFVCVCVCARVSIVCRLQNLSRTVILAR